MSFLQTLWLTVTNVLLGVVVLLFVAGTVIALLFEVVDWHRRRTMEKELDHDMDILFGRTRK